jgi:hypothetical protein
VEHLLYTWEREDEIERMKISFKQNFDSLLAVIRPDVYRQQVLKEQSIKRFEGIEQRLPSQSDVSAVREFKNVLAQLEKQKASEEKKLYGEDDW